MLPVHHCMKMMIEVVEEEEEVVVMNRVKILINKIV
jgi:hypothetical protein